MAIPVEEEISEVPESESQLTLDVSDDDTFSDASAGDSNVCVTVWGTVRSNDGSVMVLDVERAELMPDSADEEEGDDSYVKPSKGSKNVVAIMIGKPSKG